MKTLILALLLSITSLQASANDRWTDAEINKQVAISGLFLLDYAQTRDIKNHPELEEKNIFLGQHPSKIKIRNYFIGATVLHYLLVDSLSTKNRKLVQDGTIKLELIVIGSNKRIGLSYKF